MATQTAQEEFDKKYITTTGIIAYLGVCRTTVHMARCGGKLPDPVDVQGQIYIWERDTIMPYLKAWKLMLDARRSVTA